MIANRETASYDVCNSAVFALPELVADHQPRFAATSHVVCWREEAAKRGLNTQSVECVTANIKHPRRAHLPARSEVNAVRAPGEDTRKRFLPLPDLLPNRIADGGKRRVRETSARPFHIRETHLGQLVRSLYRERLQAHRVDQLKDCRVRADAQTQRKHGHRSE